MKEIWREIQDYPTYKVSNLGRVLSNPHVIHMPHQDVLSKPRLLKQRRKENGYMQVNLSKNNHAKNFYAHRLVASAFIPNPFNLPEINHKDENKENNSVSNLEWCTSKYNLNYGSWKDMRSTLSAKPIVAIDKEGHVRWFKSIKEAARQLGLWDANIGHVLHGQAHTSGGYYFEYTKEKENKNAE